MNDCIVFTALLAALFGHTAGISPPAAHSSSPPVDNAVLGQFPYQAAIKDISFGFAFHSCGATVYDNAHVLTAAHCVYGVTNSTLQYLQVVAGDFDIALEESTEQTVSLLRIVSHQDYDHKTKRNDIAVLTLKEPLVFSANTVMAATPITESVTVVGDCRVTGWAVTTEDGVTPTVMQAFEVPLLPASECEEVYGNGTIPDSALCAGSPNGRIDSCSGMAGGPLTCYNGDGVPYFTGIVSGGTGCSIPGYPGVYTDVAYYRHWITENTK